MSLRLGDIAPDFTQESTIGPIHFHDWIGTSWAVLFSHPADFTTVCTTELGEASRLDRHRSWAADIAETQGTALNFPLLADADRNVAPSLRVTKQPETVSR
jgi:alkyl hydroperoxide reductase subunit AhpC